MVLCTTSCFGPTTSSGEPPSHFHVELNSANVTIDCTKLDNSAQVYSSSLVSVGGASASTSETFQVYLPNGAAALRAPSALGVYPIADGNGTAPPVAFQIQLIVYDKPTPAPDPNPAWISCAPGECGLPTPDPAHYHQITSITEQASSTPGMATFRVSGSFVALVSTPQQGGPATATATGDWSLLVTVPDPGQ
jgi:hypothetical protein